MPGYTLTSGGRRDLQLLSISEPQAKNLLVFLCEFYMFWEQIPTVDTVGHAGPNVQTSKTDTCIELLGDFGYSLDPPLRNLHVKKPRLPGAPPGAKK